MFLKAGIACVLSMALPGIVSAKEFVPVFGVNVESHSNATRGNSQSPLPKRSDTIVTPYIGLNFSETVDKVNAEMAFRLERQVYTEGSFDDQNFLSIDGFLDYEVVPGRFIWATEDSASTRRIILQDPATPDNLQTFNVFTTGPDLFFTRGVNEIIVKGRIGDVHYSDQLADNNRLIGSVALRRPVSEVSTVGLNASASLIRFQQDFQVDYDIVSLLTRYDRETPWGSIGLEGGYNLIDFENGVSDEAPVIQGSLVVGGKEGSANSLTFTASQKFSDPALDVFDPAYTRLFNVQGVGVVDTNEKAGTGASRERRGEVAFEHYGDLYGIKLFGYYQDLDRPVDLQQSQLDKGAGINAGLALSENVNVWASALASRSDFVNIEVGNGLGAGEPVHVDGRNVAAGINWQVWQNLTFAAGVRRDQEKSNSVQRRFTDDIVFMSLQYQGESQQRE